MDVLNRTQRVVVLANDYERDAWARFASDRGMRLGPFIRLAINNATGVNDPPELEPFTDADLAAFTRMTLSEGDLRTMLREERLTPRTWVFPLSTLVLVLACLAIQVGALAGFWVM